MIFVVYLFCFLNVKRYDCCCNIFSQELISIKSILQLQNSYIMRSILWFLNYAFLTLDPFLNIIRLIFTSKINRSFKNYEDTYFLVSFLFSVGLYVVPVYIFKVKPAWCLIILIWRTLTIFFSHLKTVIDYSASLQGIGILKPQNLARTIIFTFKSILELSLCYAFFYYCADVVNSNYLLNALSVFTTQGIDSRTFSTACFWQQFIIFTQLLLLLNTFIFFLSNIFNFFKK